MPLAVSLCCGRQMKARPRTARVALALAAAGLEDRCLRYLTVTVTLYFAGWCIESRCLSRP
jgi:hypothetical protein